VQACMLASKVNTTYYPHAATKTEPDEDSRPICVAMIGAFSYERNHCGSYTLETHGF
jgi:predicted secreted protein